MSLPTLIYIHGWSYGPEIFDPLSDTLASFPSKRLDLGFFGSQDLAVPEGQKVVIAHSFGLLWYMCERPFEADAVISLNGFTRFGADHSFPNGIPQRLITRMRRRLKTDPVGVIRDFHILCGEEEPDPPLEFDQNRLDWGLEALQTWDGSSSWSHLTCPTLTLTADEDQVVPRALSEACFGRLDGCPSASHLMPKTDAQWCAESIRGILSSL